MRLLKYPLHWTERRIRSQLIKHLPSVPLIRVTPAVNVRFGASLGHALPKRRGGRNVRGIQNEEVQGQGDQTRRSRFNDVTSGNNDWTGALGGKSPATAHHHLSAGLGTPGAPGLAVSI